MTVVLFPPCEPVCVCVSSGQHVVLETPNIAITNTPGFLSTLPGVYLAVDILCHYDSVATVQDPVIQLDSHVVEIKMKAEFRGRCGPSKGRQTEVYSMLTAPLKAKYINK